MSVNDLQVGTAVPLPPPPPPPSSSSLLPLCPLCCLGTGIVLGRQGLKTCLPGRQNANVISVHQVLASREAQNL